MRAHDTVQTAVFVTALQLECLAVKSHLTDIEEVVGPRGTVYEVGRFAGRNGSWSIVLVEAGAGNLPAAVETERAISLFNPDVLMFVGVAGGIKDVAVGDVVAATKMYGYESGKSKAVFEPRPNVMSSSYVMQQRARAVARNGKWKERIIGAVPRPEVRAVVAPIAAGEKVIASGLSPDLALLRSVYGDAVAVEMEGRGFLEAAFSHPQIEYLVVRGISDLIEGKSQADASGSQPTAARHAAAFALETLANLRVERGSHGQPDEVDHPARPANTSTGPPFIGRAREVQEITELLKSERLVTLTGMGGIGKTRLAHHVLDQHANTISDLTFVVDLSGLSDGSLIGPTIGAAIGLQEKPGVSYLDLIANAVGNSRVVFLLDSCEHLRTSAAKISAHLLRSCPALRILVTSQQCLGLAQEIEYQVQPMGLPGESGCPSKDEALQHDGVLFLATLAARRLSSFVVTEENMSALVRLCRHLEGIPLAMELAAPWLKLMSLEELYARLSERFRILQGSDPTRPSRHQTLQATLDWSHALLTGEERLLLRRLSVFRGGFTFQGAFELTKDALRDEHSVLDVLAGLNEKSWLRCNMNARPTRYTMLETVREYAARELGTSPDYRGSVQAYVDHIGDLIEKANETQYGPEALMRLERLEAEHDNIRQVLGWLRSRGNPQDLMKMTHALGHFYLHKGHISEGRMMAEYALEHAGSAQRKSGVGGSLLNLASALCLTQGDYLAALRYGNEAVTVVRSVGDAWQLEAVLSNLVQALHHTGHTDHALVAAEECVQLNEQSGDLKGLANALNTLAYVLAKKGETKRANGLYQRSADLCSQLGDMRGCAAAQLNIAVARGRDGDYEGAAELAKSACGLIRELGDDWALARAQLVLADIQSRLRRHKEAYSIYKEVSRAALDLQTFGLFADALDGAGECARHMGATEEPMKLIGCADAIRYRGGRVSDDGDLAARSIATTELRAALGSQRSTDLYREGREMAVEEAAKLVESLTIWFQG